MLSARIAAALLLLMLGLTVRAASAQTDPDDCRPYVLAGTVLECTATGSMRAQLRSATFIAGSAATGETLAQAIALEVGTAPLGSSSGGFTFTFDRGRLAWNRTSSTFGPAFSERALTLGRRKLSIGFNFLHRQYDSIDGLDLHDFEIFRFRGGSLPVSTSNLELETRTDTFAAFAHYGLLDRLDLGVSLPYARVAIKGTSRITAQPGEVLQRVRLDSTTSGVGDMALSGKYRFWQSTASGSLGQERHTALAVGVTARLPTGSSEDLLGLGVGRALVSLIGSGAAGRYSPHLNLGYEFWTGSITTPRDFQGTATISIKDAWHYNAGLEFEVRPRLTVVGDLLGRYLRGGGRVGYQPFFFPPNQSNVQGAEALVAVPDGFHRVIFAPGAKWNFYRAALLTANVLIAVSDGGLRDRVTPVVGIDWGF